MAGVDKWQLERERLVEILRREGIRDERVLQSIGTVPRHLFVSPEVEDYAYENVPLAIGKGQTISQPFIVALMAEALQPKPSDRVLEVGTGSGYAAAVLSKLVRKVYTIERYAELAEEAQKRFSFLKYGNIEVRVGDGTKGWEEESPFDGIVVAAAGPAVPPSLKRQLAVGGRLVIPIGDRTSQKLVKVVRLSHKEFEEKTIDYVRFVPLVGEEGWPS